MNDLQTLPQTRPIQARETSPPSLSARPRDLAIDTLRGVAIFTMIAANLAAPVLVEPHPFWLRLYGSFAAPAFIVLSGMMVAYGARKKRHTLRHNLARGAVLVAVASLLDVFVWDNYPLLSMDVLYLLGVSMPVAFLCVRLDSRLRWLIIGAIVLSTPMLQQTFGYADFPKEVSFVRGSRAALAPTDFLHHWLIDGWFPLFPWLAFVVFGVQLADFRPPRSTVVDRPRPSARLWIGLAMLAGGSTLWYLFPGTFLVRAGYSELFYPPTPGFVMTAAGVVVTLLAAIDATSGLIVYRPLQLLGKSALTIYVAHLVLIDEIIARHVYDMSLFGFAVLYGGLVMAMLVIAQFEQVLKARWRNRPVPARLALGEATSGDE